jgi:diguanylate cyclase (GGDEF)-like protein
VTRDHRAVRAERRIDEAWRWFLVAGAVGLLAHRLTGGAGAQPILYELVAAASAAAIVVGVHLHRPARPRAWNLLAIAVALWVFGDLAWNANASLFDEVPVPSLADLGYLASYPFMAAGLLRMARDRVPNADRSTITEAALVTAAAALPAWVFLVAPAGSDDSVGVLARLVAVAYPLADLFLFAILVRLMMAGGRRPPAYWLLLAGAAVNLVADTLFAVPAVAAAYDGTSPIESLYLLGYLLIGAAALHPSMVQLTTRSHERARSTSRVRLLWLGLAGAAAPGVMAIEAAQGEVRDVALIVVGWCAVVALGVVRLGFAGDDIVTAGQRDPLTLLPNRGRLLAHVERILRDRADVALVYLDIDRFHRVNETIGEAAGDRMLVEVGERLRKVVRPGDVVARVGGDEFAVVCQDVPDDPTARAVGQRLMAGLAEPFFVADSPYFLSASIGIARPTSTVVEAASLLRDADVALKRAKRRGTSGAEVFDPDVGLSASLRTRFELDLGRAIEEGELELHYQPLIDLRTEQAAGVEALIRWQHPDWGTTKPESLLPVADDTGLIVPIGRWVLTEGLRQLRAWERSGAAGAPRELTVNVARRELLDPAFVDALHRALDRAAIQPRSLVLDVDDEAIADATSPMLDALQRVRALGVRICIDRFGMGRHTLANARRVPADRWKLDPSFVRAVADDHGDRVVANAVLQLGASLGVQVVAVGVETRSQRVQLERMGCTLAQGNLWAPPLPPGSVLDSVLRRS